MRRARVIIVLCLFLAGCSTWTPTNTPSLATIAAPTIPTIDTGLVTPSSTFTPPPTSSPTSTPTSTWTPTLEPTPTATPTPSPLMSIKVLSFNILYGAGVERQFDSALPSSWVGTSRLPKLLSYVKTADPDIWGIEEANGWDRGTPPVIDQVAQELGMRSLLIRTPGGFHLGLLTKFEIVESRDLSAQVGRQGVLRVRLRTKDGSELYVFLVHLEPNLPDTRLCEVNTLVQLMRPYLTSRTILIGDMNFRPATREHFILEQAGWMPVAVESDWRIDQIWIAPAVKWSATSWFPSLSLPSEISDHNPIGAGIEIYPAFAPVSAPPPLSPTPTVTTPDRLPATWAGTLVSKRFDFDDLCDSARWSSRWKTEKISKGVLEITGEAPWQASVSRYKYFLPGEGVGLRFQFTRGSEFEISFDNGLWNAERYRRFGINLRDDSAQAVIWQSAVEMRGENLKGNLFPQPDTWYDLIIAPDKQGEFTIQLRDPAAPTQVLDYRGRVADVQADLPWILGIGVDKGKLSIDNVAELILSK